MPTPLTQKYKGYKKNYMAKNKLPPIPKHPDGTPMLRLTPRGTLERTKYKGKLRALPRGYKIPPEYLPNEQTVKKKSPKCQAPKDGNSSSGSGLCMQDAGWGTAHLGYGPCKLHGGNLPMVAKKYIRQMEAKNMTTFGEPIEVDPHTAVLNMVHFSAGHVQWLHDKIQALSEVEGDMTLHQYTAMGIKASVWVEMYERERMMLLRASKGAVDMGVSERQVQLAEEQGRMIAMVLQKFIDSQDIGLTPEQRAVAPKVIRELLTSMPQTPKPGEVVRSLPATTLSPPTTGDDDDDEEWEDFGG